MRRRLRCTACYLAIALSLLAEAPTFGSQEGMLRWSSFSIDSEGIGSSGTFVNQVMMVGAQQSQILDAGLAAVEPVLDVAMGQ